MFIDSYSRSPAPRPPSTRLKAFALPLRSLLAMSTVARKDDAWNLGSENTQIRRGLLSALDRQLSTVNRLTPLESALPENSRVTRLESALRKSLDLKSFRTRTCRKGWGEGASC